MKAILEGFKNSTAYIDFAVECIIHDCEDIIIECGEEVEEYWGLSSDPNFDNFLYWQKYGDSIDTV